MEFQPEFEQVYQSVFSEFMRRTDFHELTKSALIRRWERTSHFHEFVSDCGRSYSCLARRMPSVSLHFFFSEKAGCPLKVRGDLITSLCILVSGHVLVQNRRGRRSEHDEVTGTHKSPGQQSIIPDNHTWISSESTNILQMSSWRRQNGSGNDFARLAYTWLVVCIYTSTGQICHVW